MKTKEVAYITLIVLMFQSCVNNKPKQSDKDNGTPVLAVQNEIHNFGSLEAGEIVSYSFKVTNNGEGNLIIDSVNYSCGCLEVRWTENPIKKGESGYVSVTYDSSGEWGNMYKTIEIFSNAEETKKNIYIAAKVNNQLFNQE